MRVKSPGYPNVNLQQAIDSARKLFNKNRLNVIDREAATKDIGYTGLTGASTKMLSNLSHFGLIEKAGKGGVRVTQLAARVIHPRDRGEEKAALLEAAYSPDLYAAIKENWPDGFVSENALQGYLAREEFAAAAISGAVSSYMETYQFLQQSGATESHGPDPSTGQNAVVSTGADAEGHPGSAASLDPPSGTLSTAQPVRTINTGIELMDGERVVFVEESGPAQYLKLVANGELDDTMLEALEDYIKRQKKRLAVTQSKQPTFS